MDGTVLETIVNLSVLVFVITSMLAMGFSLTVPQILEPLRDMRLVAIALAVNFVAVPAVAYAIDAVLDLDESLFIGLILVATAGGAPFLPKLAQVAKGDIAFSVGLMVLLMVVTVLYMPLTLPLFLGDDVSVDAWEIASSLIFLMLLPLGIALFIRWRYEDTAAALEGLMSTTSTVAIAILGVGGIIASWDDIRGLVGTRGILAMALLLVISLAIGYFAGGSDTKVRSVMGLGTAQRNLSAALVVGAQNFSDQPDVVAFILTIGLVGLVVLMLAGGELGRREPDAETAAATG